MTNSRSTSNRIKLASEQQMGQDLNMMSMKTMILLNSASKPSRLLSMSAMWKLVMEQFCSMMFNKKWFRTSPYSMRHLWLIKGEWEPRAGAVVKRRVSVISLRMADAPLDGVKRTRRVVPSWQRPQASILWAMVVVAREILPWQRWRKKAVSRTKPRAITKANRRNSKLNLPLTRPP